LPLKIERFQNHLIWINDDSKIIQELSSSERIYSFQKKVVASNNLTLEQKQAAIHQSAGKKFIEHARYVRKKTLKKSSGDWNMVNILLSSYVGATILKTAVDDDTMSISMYSKNVIKYINDIHNQSI